MGCTSSTACMRVPLRHSAAWVLLHTDAPLTRLNATSVGAARPCELWKSGTASLTTTPLALAFPRSRPFTVAWGCFAAWHRILSSGSCSQELLDATMVRAGESRKGRGHTRGG
jgi:hypothetical protein